MTKLTFLSKLPLTSDRTMGFV